MIPTIDYNALLSGMFETNKALGQLNYPEQWARLREAEAQRDEATRNRQIQQDYQNALLQQMQVPQYRDVPISQAKYLQQQNALAPKMQLQPAPKGMTTDAAQAFQAEQQAMIQKQREQEAAARYQQLKAAGQLPTQREEIPYQPTTFGGAYATQEFEKFKEQRAEAIDKAYQRQAAPLQKQLELMEKHADKYVGPEGDVSAHFAAMSRMAGSAAQQYPNNPYFKELEQTYRGMAESGLKVVPKGTSKEPKTEEYTLPVGQDMDEWIKEQDVSKSWANDAARRDAVRISNYAKTLSPKERKIYLEKFKARRDQDGNIYGVSQKEDKAPAQVLKMVMPGAQKPRAIYQQVTGVPGMTFNKETGEYAIKVKGKSIPVGDSERVAQERENFRQRITEASVRGGVQTAKYVAAADTYDKEITEIIDLRNKVAAKLPDMKFTTLNAAQQWWGTKTSDKEINELKRRTKLLADTLSRTMGGTGGQWAFQLANELLDTSLDAGTFAAVARDHGKTLRNMATAYQSIGKPSSNDPLGIR